VVKQGVKRQIVVIILKNFSWRRIRCWIKKRGNVRTRI